MEKKKIKPVTLNVHNSKHVRTKNVPLRQHPKTTPNPKKR